MNRSIRAIVVGGVLVGAGAWMSAQGAGPRVLVLDQQARTVTALELPSGRAAATASLQGAPSQLLRTADGQRVLVLDRGEGRDAGDNGFQAKTRAAVTILDGRTLAVRGRVELGWGLDPSAMLSSTGDRLSVVAPGFQGRTPAESLTRELVTVDLAAATVLSRVELPRRATAFLATPDGRTAVVLAAREEARKAPVLPAELRFLDLVAGTVTATVPLEGDPGGPVLAPDGQFLYLLDRGRPNNNPDRNVNGRLHAVSMATRAVQGVTEVGSKPRGLVLDDRARQLFLLSDTPPVKGGKNGERPGELRVIRDGAPSAPIAVGTGPERLEVSADGQTMYVLGTYSLAKVALPGLTPTPPMTFKNLGTELTVGPNGQRLFMLNGEYVMTFDLQTGQKIADVRTGRMGKKMLLSLNAGLKTEASRLSGQRKARDEGRSYYSYYEYTLRAPRGSMVLRPDGKAVYALNDQTSDVTVIDAQSGEIIEKVAAGGFAVHFMPSAGVALLPDSATVHTVDLATNQKLADVVTDTSGNFDRAELSPDARLAVVYGSGGVLIVDASSGKAVGTMKTFGLVTGVVVEWGAQPR
jgi:DNA-binding beta-propeller fold protein YncE